MWNERSCGLKKNINIESRSSGAKGKGAIECCCIDFAAEPNPMSFYYEMKWSC